MWRVGFGGQDPKMVCFLLSLCTKLWNKECPLLFPGSAFGRLVFSQKLVSLRERQHGTRY